MFANTAPPVTVTLVDDDALPATHAWVAAEVDGRPHLFVKGSRPEAMAEALEGLRLL